MTPARSETTPSTYPDPSAPHSVTGSGPFYTQATNEQQPPSPDLQQLRDAQPGIPRGHSPQYQAAQPNFPGHPHTLGDALREDNTHQSLAQGVLSIGDGEQGQQAAFEDASAQPARKRSKVSRACDECRRKKIKCDAEQDHSTILCTNCKKSGAVCQFSRQPMKRGPSKGYIKELSERLNALENQQAQQQYLQNAENHSNLLQPLSDQYIHRYRDPRSTPPPLSAEQDSRKRTYSTSQRQTPVAQDDPRSVEYSSSRQLHQPLMAPANQSLPQQQPSPDVAHSRHQGSPGAQSAWRLRDQAHPGSARPSSNFAHDADNTETDSTHLPEWDEEVMDEYFRLIHQTFPLLPHSKSRIRRRLATCSTSLREAFFVALDVTLRTYPSTHLQGLQDHAKQTKRAAELLATSQFEDGTTGSLAHSLVYVQTLILMALQADNYGPATLRGQVGPPRGEWLGRAIGVAGNLKLNATRSRDRVGEGDPDADERLGRRIWWILFILDRWHSSSTSTLLQVPENSSSLEAEDQIMFGEGMYQLARLSCILGHLTQVLQQPSLMAPGSKAAPIITLTLLGEIDRFRESVENLLLGVPTLVHLSYWHVRLLVLRLTSSTTPHELLTPAVRMANALNSASTVLTPLNHHFGALCALTLVELCGFEETRREAQGGLEDIAAALGGRRGLMGREDSTGWDSAIRELVTRKRAQISGGGLQHLAEAAVGGAGASATQFDPTLLIHNGYLAALVQDAQAG